MINVEFKIQMTCVSECDDLVEIYQEEAKQAVINGLRRHIRELGVKISEIKVDISNIERR